MKNHVDVTTITGEAITHEGGDWVRKTKSGALQVRKGRFRVLTTYRPLEWRTFLITSRSGPASAAN
jgi:hypothetical protein